MAVMTGNQLFPNGRNYFLDGTLDWDTDVWYCYFCDHGVDQPDDTDDFADDHTSQINSATDSTNRIASPVATDGDGVADGGDVTMTSVSGNEAESLVVAREVTSQASSSTNEVLVFVDTATGLAVTPNGGDITITWDSGANKIFKL